jgi:opacity protein-like surface antigen
MKKTLSGILLICTGFIMAQDLQNQSITKTKFQVGVHYVGNLRNNNIFSDGFNGILGISGNYTFHQNELIVLSGGINLDYLQTRNLFLEKDILIWNPNVSIEVDIFKGKLKPFFGIGYAFFSNKVEFDTPVFDPSDPAIMTRETKFNFNGITINPGLKYHISSLLYIEGNYKYFPLNSGDLEGTANIHLINLGVGFKF